MMDQTTKANFFHVFQPQIPNTNIPTIPVNSMTKNHSPQDLCLLGSEGLLIPCESGAVLGSFDRLIVAPCNYRHSVFHSSAYL